jgi:DNA repair exonuclease SbcCD ATPase subunit
MAHVDVSPGVTVLTGRNATNRTSFLQGIMAAMGSSDVSLKGDADEGSVEFSIGEETYTRTLQRSNGRVTTGGDPYLDDPEIADLFGFLLETNEARRAVARGDDLREIIMRPVDTEAIQAEIRQFEGEKERIDDELTQLESLKDELPQLEEEREQITDQIERKRKELEETEQAIERRDRDVDETRKDQQELEERLQELRDRRSELERVRSDIDVQQESIESLRKERHELEAELDELSEVPMEEFEELETRISRARSRKESVEEEVSRLQDVIHFNESALTKDARVFGSVLTSDEPTSGEVTDQLTGSETIVCWTCGSEVVQDRIEDTLDELRDVRREKLDDIRQLETTLAELTTQQEEYEEQRRRRESIDRKRNEITTELDTRKERLDDLREQREQLNAAVETLEAEINERESDEFSEILDLHKEANQLEFELERLESELDDVRDRITTIEDRLAEESQLNSQREEIQNELTDLRTRIDQIEAQAVEEFNEHMDAVLDILKYENLERVWIERLERRVTDGGRKVDQPTFELHVVRSTESGATYEDTVDHLSESEREVTGLVFGLAGYRVHDLHEKVPFMLLDSLEAIDSARLAELVDYIADFPRFLIVAVLPEDAQALDEAYDYVTEI